MAKIKQLQYYLELIKTFTLRRLFNFVLVETGFILSRLFGKVFVFGAPWSASIEPTTSCNLRCPECPTGMQSLKRPKGIMGADEFGKILNKLSPHLQYLTLYFQGEPLLNPNFFEMVRMARSRSIFVATSTNGHFLNGKNAEQIIKSGLNHLIISIDGTDQQMYEKYRINGNLQTVTEGIRRLTEARRTAKSSSPFIELQFLVMRHNEHQMKQMIELAHQFGGDKLTFKTAQVYNFDGDESIIPTIKGKSRYRQQPDGTWVIANKIRNRCYRIWSSVVITWDGKVVPCCYDKDAEHQLGNLMHEPLNEIWKNRDYSAFRRQLLKNRSETEICRNCGE